MSDIEVFQTQQNEEKQADNEELLTVADVINFKKPEELIVLPEETEINQDALSPYDKWVLNPTQDNLANVTKSLKPTIDSVIANYGDLGNPQIKSKANVITAKAIQTYDPSFGVSLPTYVSSQLRQLTRTIRQSNNVLSIPEGVQLDAYAIYRAEKEFEDENGREPTLEELSDATHLSKKRITTIRKKNKAVVMDTATTSEEGTSLVGTSDVDYSKDAFDYIYNDSDTTDKKLLEYITGYGGITPLDNKTIMQKLKLTPVQLTRRKMRLSKRIMDIIHELEKQ